MRRALVLSDVGARHPFRASLPPQRLASGAANPARPARWLAAEDLRDFLVAFCACFVVVTVFIA